MSYLMHIEHIDTGTGLKSIPVLPRHAIRVQGSVTS